MQFPMTSSRHSSTAATTKILALPLAIGFAIATWSAASSQADGDPADFEIGAAAVAGGGGSSQGGEFALTGTIGQVVAQRMLAGDFAIQAGFWEMSGPTCELADITCDGRIDGADLSLLLSNWGPCDDCRSDITNDNSVDGADLSILLSFWQ